MSDSYKKISSMDVEDRLPAFRKDANEESSTQLINECLAPIQKRFETAATKSYPILLILGTQRSGTTLLYQLLASRLDIGYPSNLMARFYEVPSVGVFLQKILIGSRLHEKRRYESMHGATKDIEDPHEFGYFWSRHLGVCSDVHEPDNNELKKVDIKRLKIELDSIIGLFDKPVVFKCLLADFFIPLLKEIPNILFVDLRRNLIDTAYSTLRVREERLGSIRKWWSLRPKNYPLLRELSPMQQIAGQIMAIRKAIERDLANVEEERKLVVQYEELVEVPETIVEKLIRKLHCLGYYVEKVGYSIPSLNNRKRSPIPTKIQMELTNAFEIFGEVL